jgi:glucosamine--fructose-6-phosphate aminotransferase (isomerizing)
MSMTTQPGIHTYAEITTQADAWADALHQLRVQADQARARWSEGAYQEVLFTGCGSTHYLSLSAAVQTQRLTGTLARGLPASELMLYPEVAQRRGVRALLVAVSRSAETTETVRVAQRWTQNGVWCVSCYNDRPLNRAAALTLAAPKAQEQSIAQTRSFAAMLIMCHGLAALLADPKTTLAAWTPLPEAADHLLREHAALAQRLADPARFQNVFYLGSAVRYGLACEAMLKLKEMSLSHAEAFHFLEFRHGPKSMVDAQTLVVGLLGDRGHAEECAVLAEMRALGATVLALTPTPSALPAGAADYTVRLDFLPLPEEARGALYLPVLQLLAYHRAMDKNLDPDHPANLDAVVRL